MWRERNRFWTRRETGRRQDQKSRPGRNSQFHEGDLDERTRRKLSEEEYSEFYNHISHDWNPPLAHLHVKLEGATEYSALLYVPSRAPFDFFHQEQKHGIQLYCKRVFIMENCKELMPPYLAFVKGVVDAPDLNLNVSREILQQDALVKNIRKNLVKKVLGSPGGSRKRYNMNSSSRNSVPCSRPGISIDYDNRDKISLAAPLQDNAVPRGHYISLADYVNRMKPDQDGIYYITGENLTTLLNSPHLERLKEKDYEVLLMTDPMDEWVLRDLHEYEKKPFKSAEKGDLDLGKQVDDQKKQEYHALFDYIKTHLGGAGEGGKAFHPSEGFRGLSFGRRKRYECLPGKGPQGNRPGAAAGQAGFGTQYGASPARQDQDSLRER